jgi:hypothetical protein
MITRRTVGEKLEAYLNKQITLAELVDWAETEMIDTELEEGHEKLIFEILARIGASNVPEFKLYWEEITDMLEQLGYRVNVELETA